jgi:hypothetical protein
VGPLGITPGSHLLEAPGPPDEWQGAMMDNLPGHIKATVAAGAMILFDMRCWHAGLPYTGSDSIDRDNITVTYAAPLPLIPDAKWPAAWSGNEPQKGEYTAHHWPTQCYGEWLRQGQLQHEAGRLGTAVRKQLFGVELTHPAVAADAHPRGEPPVY